MRREVLGVCFDKTGKKLVSCSVDRTIRIWDATTGDPIGSPLAGDNAVLCVSFSVDGKTIAAGDGDIFNSSKGSGNVRLYDVQTGEVKSTLGGDKAVHCVSFSPDGDMLAAGDGDARGGNVRLYDVQTGEVKSTLTGHRYVPSL